MDEIRIYNRSLTASEISILYLGGSVEFTTSNERQPPVVELYQASPESNNSVLLSGELTNIDLENPLVTIYYGSSDGGLSISGWENNLTLNNGNPCPRVNLTQIYLVLSQAKSIFSEPMLRVRMVQTGQPENQRSKKIFWHFGDWTSLLVILPLILSFPLGMPLFKEKTRMPPERRAIQEMD
jgi:hypothetical protein